MNRGFTIIEMIISLSILSLVIVVSKPIKLKYINYNLFKSNMYLAQRKAISSHEIIHIKLNDKSYAIDDNEVGDYDGDLFSFRFNAKGNISQAKTVRVGKKQYTFYLGSGKSGYRYDNN